MFVLVVGPGVPWTVESTLALFIENNGSRLAWREALLGGLGIVGLCFSYSSIIDGIVHFKHTYSIY